jgi:hypothetical protein
VIAVTTYHPRPCPHSERYQSQYRLSPLLLAPLSVVFHIQPLLSKIQNQQKQRKVKAFLHLIQLFRIDKVAISSCPPGTVLTGLSVIKDQPDPVALPDDQYPAWLWTVLDDDKVKLEKGEKKEGGEVDFAMQKKRLRAQ